MSFVKNHIKMVYVMDMKEGILQNTVLLLASGMKAAIQMAAIKFSWPEKKMANLIIAK